VNDRGATRDATRGRDDATRATDDSDSHSKGERLSNDDRRRRRPTTTTDEDTDIARATG